MASKLTEEQKQQLKQLEVLIGNPLNALDVYAPFKRFEEYYVLVVDGNLHVKIQRTYGRVITERILECRQLLPKCQFGTRLSKLQSTESFLYSLQPSLAAWSSLCFTTWVCPSIKEQN